jgi:hypothetical protein
MHSANVILPFPDIGFSVKYLEPPGGFSPRVAGVFYTSLSQNIAKDFPGGKLTREEPITVSGESGRQYTIDMPRGSGKERVVIHKGRIYTLVVAGTDLDRNDPAVEKFFNSFQFTD